MKPDLVFPSKRDRWLTVLMMFAFVMMAFSFVVLVPALPRGDIGRILTFVLLVATTVFSVGIFARTSYTVNDSNLVVSCGMLRWIVPVTSIVSVSPTDDPSSAPALSLDRLLIKYEVGGEMREILISPADQRGFIETLRAANAAIAA
jgi:hypothetical protein